MNITLPSGQKIKLFIQHEHEPGYKECPKGHPVKVKTSARINIEIPADSPTNITQVFFQGNAYCSVLDQFKKKTGVRIAVTRALREARFSREDRTTIWKRVWNR